ncbi:hypothetical protein QCA50_006830 [Cerrena zonata]|uniref:Uncharacterized protein n=1 Tax=Cerrena zonata TaxID=2478898 RepID=A0AAW0GED8_9APHY
MYPRGSAGPIKFKGVRFVFHSSLRGTLASKLSVQGTPAGPLLVTVKYHLLECCFVSHDVQTKDRTSLDQSRTKVIRTLETHSLVVDSSITQAPVILWSSMDPVILPRLANTQVFELFVMKYD